jgi:four helix bundle protein
MSSFRSLVAWQKAMDLVDDVYRAVGSFPRSEIFVLSQQMRSSAISVPSNIAEGRGRWSLPEYRQFLRHARGSTLELETQILIAGRQRFIDADMTRRLVESAQEVGRLINGLLRSTTKAPP